VFPTEEVIHQLRHRLLNPAFGDSVETKIAILGEIVIACYYQMMKKREL
jgi:hypothetical protein